VKKDQVEGRRAGAVKEIKILRNDIQIFRNEIQVGRNKFQIRRNEIQIKCLAFLRRI
jgi:hypothetical protein